MALTVLAVKGIIMSSLFLIGVICVMLPRALKKVPDKYRDYVVSLGQAGSGGIFLSAAMVDMLPDGLEDFYSIIPDNLTLAAQITNTVFLAGFILIFFIEKVVFIGLLEPRSKNKHTETIPNKLEDKLFTENSNIDNYNRKSNIFQNETSPVLLQTSSDYSIQTKLKREKKEKSKGHSHGKKEKACTHKNFSIECLTDNEESLLSRDEPYGDVKSTNYLNPVDVLERTLSHGFNFVPGSKSEKVAIALDLVEGKLNYNSFFL